MDSNTKSEALSYINKNFLLPGDHIAYIEEFESGKDTYVSEGSVRSSALGLRDYNLKHRMVSVDRKNKAKFPKVGDEIIGYIEMLFSSMISIKILYLNNTKVGSGLSAIASTKISTSGGIHPRRDRERRPKLIYRVGDIVRGRIFSLMNSSSHATIDDKNLGVVYCLCYNCGGETVKLNSSIKCIDCGMSEEKKLTSDFGKDALLRLENVIQNRS
jgi:exosome complex component CSL4